MLDYLETVFVVNYIYIYVVFQSLFVTPRPVAFVLYSMSVCDINQHSILVALRIYMYFHPRVIAAAIFIHINAMFSRALILIVFI